MNDYLISDAVRKVWCTPDQDNQLIIEPTKISGFGGDLNTTLVHTRRIDLPSKGSRFHVYHLGQTYPLVLGLPAALNQWRTIAYGCNVAKLIIDIYASSGIQLPRAQTWYMFTEAGLTIAVKSQSKIPVDLNAEPLFVRVYKNAYFASIESDSNADKIEVSGGVVSSTADIIAYQTTILGLKALPGVVYSFVNGYLVDSIDLITTAINDVVEYVYDSSVKEVIEFNISDLPAFISELDNKNKYLIHPTNATTTIDYLDDVDFFITEQKPNSRYTGIYYHKNMVDAVRMVTHKDYSIVVPYMVGYLDSVPGWTDITNLTLRLHIRKSGYNRPLILESNRIEELYKLNDAEIIRAMVGVNSTVPNWTASELEKSSYTKLMGSLYKDINRQLVQDAYGYNLIATTLGNTPSLIDTTSGQALTHLPFGLVNDSVGYEYDSNGRLLGWHYHQYGTAYIAQSPSCKVVESIAGVVDTNLLLDEVYGHDDLFLDGNYDYRFYKCQVMNGIPTNKWVDVTNTADYTRTGNTVIWNLDPEEFYPMVRSDKNILAYDKPIIVDDGIIKLTLWSGQNRAGEVGLWTLQVPMGELTVFLNGYSLINGIDYVFNFPEIVIMNKSHLIDVLNIEQLITIRYTGFCNSDFSSDVVIDKGFIKHGLLSNNNRFDIRDDKVLRMTIGGAYITKDNLEFAENGVDVVAPNAINGLPYSISDIVVPMRGNGYTDTYTARAKSRVIDNDVSDYLTRYHNHTVANMPNIINSKYSIFSPFCNKIIYDLKYGHLNDARLFQQYSDADVFDICTPYLPILKFDPTQPANAVDSDYVTIHPHNLNTVMELTIHQYKFIDRVIKLYLNNLVSLTASVTLST